MTSWGYAAGWLRSLENYFIPYNELLHLCDSRDENTFLRSIKDSFYSEMFTSHNLYQYDAILNNHLQELYKTIQKIIPDDQLIRIRKLNNDLNNLKIIYKAKNNGRDIEWEILSDDGIYPPEDMYTIIEEKQTTKLPKVIANAIYILEQELKRRHNPQLIDFIIDNAFNDYRFELLHRNRTYRSIADYYSCWVDCENIKNIFRAKRMNMEQALFTFVPLRHGTIPVEYIIYLYRDNIRDIADEISQSSYGAALSNGITRVIENHEYSQLEKEIDELLIKKLWNFHYTAFGPEVVEEFIQRKQLEVKNLKIVFIGVLNRMEAEEIKKRIRYAGI